MINVHDSNDVCRDLAYRINDILEKKDLWDMRIYTEGHAVDLMDILEAIVYALENTQ